jgi:hypothetical protein
MFPRHILVSKTYVVVTALLVTKYVYLDLFASDVFNAIKMTLSSLQEPRCASLEIKKQYKQLF